MLQLKVGFAEVQKNLLELADGTQAADGSEDARLNELLTKLG